MKTFQLSLVFLFNVLILRCLSSPKTYIIETDDGGEDDEEEEVDEEIVRGECCRVFPLCELV